MYRTALSLLIILGVAIASPVHVEKTSQATHQVKHVPIKAVRNYLNKTRLGARGLVNEFQGVIDSSPQGADVDHHRHIAKGYLPKAIQTIVTMREAADSMLRRIDENGLESPQFMGGKQECHQLKKSIDAIKEMAIENLCSQLKRQEIIAYFKSDLNCLLGSIFELWRATERDGSYLTLGYRDIIQTIKNLLVAIETGTRRFAEEINYMDFSDECQKLIHPEMPLTPSAKVQSQPSVEKKAPKEEGKKKKSEAKEEGKGVTGSTVIVAGGEKSGETSLVEKVEKVIKLEKKELDDIKAVAKKEMEKVSGKNVNVGVLGIIGGKVGEKAKEAEKVEEKKEEKEEEKKEVEAEEKKEVEAEKAEEKKEAEAEKAEEKKEAEAEKAEEKKEAEVEKEEEKKEAEEEKKEAEEEKKEAEAEKEEEKKEAEEEKKEAEEEKKEAEAEKEEKAKETEETVVEKAATGLLPMATDTNTTEHILPKAADLPPIVASVNPTGHLVPTVSGNSTSANHTSEDVGGKLKVILVKEENNLNAVLKKLDENNQTTAEEADKVEEEKKEIKKMQKELEKVIADVVAIEAIEKNKTAEIDAVVAEAANNHGNVGIIDIVTQKPTLKAKLASAMSLVLPTVVPVKALPIISTVQPKLPAKAPTSPATNLKEVENEEKSLENLRLFGKDALPAPKDKQPTEKPKEEAKPAASVLVDGNDIDAQEERDEEERAKEMVEKAKEEEKEEAKEKKEQVKEAEKEVKEEKKEAKKEEPKKEAATESKPVAKMAAPTSKPQLVPAETKNSTFDGLISHINDEEDEVRNLIQTLKG